MSYSRRLSQDLKTSRTLTNHVFATYTFKRDIEFREVWQQVNTDFNRYIQRLRRLHTGGLQYLRTVEAHSDDYPHIHAVLQFHDAITVTNVRYFDADLYSKWKQLWRSGLSDYQPPLSKRVPILYIVKYISKNSAYKTLWRKLYASAETRAVKRNLFPRMEHKPDASPALQTTVKAPAPTKQDTTLFLCKQFKIKQCTWSRGFKFPALPERYSFEHSLDKFNN